MSVAKRRGTGTTESPEEARGRLTRKLFVLYDGHQHFRSGLIQLVIEHRSAIAMCGRRPLPTPAERNKLAREMFNSVVIENRTAVAVTPRPDLRAFFETLAVAPSSVMTYGRKRRASVPRLLPFQTVLAAFAFPTCGRDPRSMFGGHRGVTNPPARGIAPVLVI